MKKYLILIVFIFSSLYMVAQAQMPFSGPGPREGALGTTLTEREAWREEMMAKRKAWMEKMTSERAAFLAEVKAKKEEWKTANQERKNMFRTNAGVMISQRFEVAVRNLERALERINALEEKLETEGKDTSEAEALLETAEEKLIDAKEKIEEIKDLIPENDDGVTPEIFEQIKLAAREAKNLLKEVHQNLIEALTTLRHLQGDDSAENEDEEENDSE